MCAVAFKWRWVGAKGSKVCPVAHHYHDHQHEPLIQGGMDPCVPVSFTPSKCCSRSWESHFQTFFFLQSSVVQFLWVCPNCSPSCLTRETHDVFSLCLSPSKFDWWIQRWSPCLVFLEAVVIWVTVGFVNAQSNLIIFVLPLASARQGSVDFSFSFLDHSL